MHIIDPTRVLLIVNSSTATNGEGQSMAQSVLDADDYVSKRGLSSFKRLAFNFGTQYSWSFEQLETLYATSSAFANMNFVNAIAYVTELWKIEAVIFSTYTPLQISNVPSLRPLAKDTLPYLASKAIQIKELIGSGQTLASAFYNTENYFTDPYTRNTYQEIITNTQQTWQPFLENQVNPFNTNKKIPYGRLGCPKISGAEIAEYTLQGGGSVYQNAVNKSLIAEQQNNLNKCHVMSQYVAYNPPNTAARNKTALDWGLQNRMSYGGGLTNVYQVSFHGDGLAPYWMEAIGNAGEYDPAIDPTIPKIFNLCLNINWNSGYHVTEQYIGRIEDGAWGYTWTSGANNWAYSILRNGGSAAITTITEPYADGLISNDQLMVLVGFYCMPIMQAAFLSTNIYNTEGLRSLTIGDPLYSPYKYSGQPFTIPQYPSLPTPPGWNIDSTHDGIIMDKRETYGKLNKEIEKKNRKQYKTEINEKERKKQKLAEIQEKYELYLKLKDKYLKSRQ